MDNLHKCKHHKNNNIIAICSHHNKFTLYIPGELENMNSISFK